MEYVAFTFANDLSIYTLSLSPAIIPLRFPSLPKEELI